MSGFEALLVIVRQICEFAFETLYLEKKINKAENNYASYA